MTIVFSKEINTEQCNASTTKMMTALVAFDLISDMQSLVTVTADDLVGSGESRVNFNSGDTLTYQDLLYGMLIPSGNDAANCLARTLGGRSNFVAAMNAKANTLGMTNSNFEDPAGIDPFTVSTAVDLYKLMLEFMRNPILVTISGTMTYSLTITGANARPVIVEHTVKPHISRFPELICAKTGTAFFSGELAQRNSGGCLVALWELPNKEKRISVVLGSGDGYTPTDRYDDLRRLMDFEISRPTL